MCVRIKDGQMAGNACLAKRLQKKMKIMGGLWDAKKAQWVNEQIEVIVDGVWKEEKYSLQKNGARDINASSDFAFIFIRYGSTAEQVIQTTKFLNRYISKMTSDGGGYYLKFGKPVKQAVNNVYGWGDNYDTDYVYAFCSSKSGKKKCEAKENQTITKDMLKSATQKISNVGQAVDKKMPRSMFEVNLKFKEVRSPTAGDSTRTVVLWPSNDTSVDNGALVHGDSGGPVFNKSGQIIGVSSYTSSYEEPAFVSEVKNVYSVIDDVWYNNNILDHRVVIDFFPKTIKANRAYLRYGFQMQGTTIDVVRKNGSKVQFIEKYCSEKEKNYPEIKAAIKTAIDNKVSFYCVSTVDFMPGDKGKTEFTYKLDGKNVPRKYEFSFN